MISNVFILSAEKHSGKTTTLLQWIENRKNVFGILTPVVDGKRVFMNVSTKEIFPMQANEKGENILSVGKFTFSLKGFEKASEILMHVSEEEGIYVIIDEVGPLELRGDGFSDSIRYILQKKNLKVILVIRDSLVNDVISYYGINKYESFDKIL